MKLRDKVAIVTGGARGIGAAICERFAAEGALVVVADILQKEAAATAKAIGGGAIGLALDVTKRPSIDAMVENVVATAGRIDILVNNAAIFDMGPLLEITEESYDRQFAINVKGLLFTLQAVAAQMVRQGQGGKIVNFSSQAGRRGEALVAVYCASKAAVISLTQSAGLALIKHKINVNAIAPGVIDTPDVGCGRFLNSPNTRTSRWARRSARSASPFPMAAWASPATSPGLRSSSPRPMPTTLSPRPSMSTAAIG